MTAALEGVSGQQYALVVFYSWETPGTHCTGGWVSPRAGLDRCGKFAPPGFDPRTVQPVVAIPTELPGPRKRMCIHLKFMSSYCYKSM